MLKTQDLNHQIDQDPQNFGRKMANNAYIYMFWSFSVYDMLVVMTTSHG